MIMGRQSLGSPSSKLQINEKTIRSNSRSNRCIHLIPLLTILCILILYLCSHDPTTKGIDGMEVIGDAVGSRRALKRAARRPAAADVRKIGLFRV